MTGTVVTLLSLHDCLLVYLPPDFSMNPRQASESKPRSNLPNSGPRLQTVLHQAVIELSTPHSRSCNLWKAFVGFDIELGKRQRTEDLYEHLVSLRGHEKV